MCKQAKKEDSLPGENSTPWKLETHSRVLIFGPRAHNIGHNGESTRKDGASTLAAETSRWSQLPAPGGSRPRQSRSARPGGAHPPHSARPRGGGGSGGRSAAGPARGGARGRAAAAAPAPAVPQASMARGAQVPAPCSSAWGEGTQNEPLRRYAGGELGPGHSGRQPWPRRVQRLKNGLFLGKRRCADAPRP